MQGVIVGLFIAVNLLLSGCGNNQTKTHAALQEYSAPQPVTVQTAGVAVPAAENPAIETIAEIETTTEIKPVATPKKIATTVKKNLAIVTPPAPSVIDPSPEPAAVIATPTPAPAAPVIKEVSNWQPNEVHLIRGSELINGLQREVGRKPNVAEMQQRLQSHMGLSALQAKQVISKLGLE